MDCMYICALYIKWNFPGGASGKEPASHCRRCKRCGFDPWVGKIPWRRERQPTPVFLPGESHGQRNLVSYSPWGPKESHTIEATEHTGINRVKIFFIIQEPMFSSLWGQCCLVVSACYMWVNTEPF